MTNQQLEKIYRVPIEDLSDDGEVKVRCKPTKLSEAWRLASKELTQIKGRLYDLANTKHVCALGAIVYYGSDDHDMSNFGHLSDQMGKFNGHIQSTYFSSIAHINDLQNWTFEDFAREAEKLGL